MEIKISVLCDNYAGLRLFRAEHGLSVLLEVEGKSFLWDCGQSDVAVHNASALGIDLRRLEGIGISHGHYDHAGGLPAALAAAGRKPLFMHPEALGEKYLAFGENSLFIGIPYRLEALESLSLGVELSVEPVEVLPGVRLTGDIPRVTDFEGLEVGLFALKEGELVPDPFPDDQSLVVDTPDGAVVLTGCAHSGLVNVLKHVLESHGRIRAVVGGTHLGLGARRERIDATLDFLEEVLPGKMILCHCTGQAVMQEISTRFKDRAVQGQTGLTMNL
jgi:7,8-dihydropterin-6-yl-methyl-4-(beta-D-ribofuranosyl)aminobenzene 5'-phosphate synthase